MRPSFKWLESKILWGILLILGGVGLLLQNLGFLPIGGLIWVLVLGVGGGIFLSIYVGNREYWWALIPGISLFGIALSVLLDIIFPDVGEILGGVIVLGGIGVSFILVYLCLKNQWWPVIPAGALFTLAVISGLDNSSLDVETGGIFFLGLGLTFLTLALLPLRDGSMRWAYIPAGVLLLIGMVISVSNDDALGLITPVFLVVSGLIIVWRTLLRRG